MLAAHIICSVGWIGAAAAYLALGVAAEVNMQPQIVRAAWIGMELSGWLVIVPLGCLALLTGLVLSLGTPWGLFKHYWVVIALVLTTLSLAVLLLHMPSVSTLAGLARTADDAAAGRLGGDVLHPRARARGADGHHRAQCAQTTRPHPVWATQASQGAEGQHEKSDRRCPPIAGLRSAAENRVGARRLRRRQACACEAGPEP
jgi:hypothetical protein